MKKPTKDVRWIGSAKDDLSQMPEDVKDEVGQSIWEVQIGQTPDNSKPMHGKLREVREIVVDDDGNTYRTVYTTKIGDYVYILDAFVKKAKKGIATPQRDLDRIAQRLKTAKEHHEKNP
jgi:phage-related protein